MLSSLLKNRGLHLKLLVGLLFVLGSFPEQSECLRCHSCSTALGEKDCNKIAECNKVFGDGYCSLQTHSRTGGQEDTLKRCNSHKVGDCWKKAFGSNCVTETDPIKVQHLLKKLGECVNGGPTGTRPEEYDSSPTTACFCQSDLCNADSDTAAISGGDGSDGSTTGGDSGGGGSTTGSGSDGSGSTTGGDPDGGGHSSSSILHPFNSIIIAVLVITYIE